MKTIITLAFASIFLVACGGGGGGSSSSSSGFAPANAAAFEAKFIGQTVTVTNTSSGESATAPVTAYDENSETYKKTGANTAFITEENGACKSTWTWTSNLAGNVLVRGICDGTNTDSTPSVTFRFSGSN